MYLKNIIKNNKITNNELSLHLDKNENYIEDVIEKKLKEYNLHFIIKLMNFNNNFIKKFFVNNIISESPEQPNKSIESLKTPESNYSEVGSLSLKTPESIYSEVGSLSPEKLEDKNIPKSLESNYKAVQLSSKDIISEIRKKSKRLKNKSPKSSNFLESKSI